MNKNLKFNNMNLRFCSYARFAEINRLILFRTFNYLTDFDT